MVLLTLLAVVTIAIIRQRNLYSVVILSGAYSFLMASVMLVLDAVDVALTEASVGAVISTVVLLATLHLTKARESLPIGRPMLALAVAGITGAALIWGTTGLSRFGTAEAPIHSHVAPRYLAESLPVMGIPNVVTAILANYRGFDTLGEITVIFTAGIGIMLLLGGRARNRKKVDRPKNQPQPMKLDLILRISTKAMLPFILLFALYVHFHGDYGPGGGFQAGVILAAGLILYAIIFGIRAAKPVVPQRLLEVLVPLGVLIFAAAGLPALVFGKNYLDYSILAGDALHGHEWGILIVETGVLITVFATLVAIFYAFVERGR